MSPTMRMSTAGRLSTAGPGAGFWARRAVVAMTPLVIVAMGMVTSSPAAMGAGLHPSGWPKGHQTAELAASDGTAGDAFGDSVAVSTDGSTAVFGAESHGGTGAVYVFSRKGKAWKQTVELTASDGVAADWFGSSVAVSADGSAVVVGADRRNQVAGAAYVFTRHHGKWTQAAELDASDSAPEDYFGDSVAISSDGTTVVVGADNQDEATGAAYVFAADETTWSQTAELTASDGIDFDGFGAWVAMSGAGSTVVVGAPAHNSATGAAYVYTHHADEWVQSAELSAANGVDGDFLGLGVAISADGSTIVAGAEGCHDSEGAAYVFSRHGKGWRQAAELTASDSTPGSYFGYAVAVSAHGTAVAAGSSTWYTYQGDAYVFAPDGKKKTWRQRAELTASDGAAYDAFGYALGISGSGSTVVVGAEEHDGWTGAGYVFRR